VARVDMLKNIKQLVLQGMNLNTTENLGTYIGDVETFDLSKVTAPQKQKITTTIEAITKNIMVTSSGSLSTFDALTRSLPNSTYSFIKVYSGIIDDLYLSNLTYDFNFLSNAIFVYIKSPKDALLPITVSSKSLENLKENAFAFIECDESKNILNTEIFQLLLESNNDKTQLIEAKQAA
jgi:hypothetical protein